MSTQAKKPEIRFAGFKDEWAKKKFDDVFDMLSNNTLSRDALNSEAGAAKNIHYGDVLTKFGEYIDVSIEKLPFISDPAIATKFIRSHLKDGDIVITDTAEDETVGKCTEVISVEEMPIIAGLHTMPCRPKEKYAPKYMGYYLNSHKYHNNLFPLMQGVKVTSISRTGVKETEVILSTEFDEQEKIGKHLSSLDNMIALETAKYEKLVIVKKAMLEKMFPKEGCDVPEIRFTGFTEAWEQRKVSDLGEVITGSTPPTKDKDNYDGSYLFVSPADIQGDRYVESTITTLTEKGFNLGRRLRPGATLFVSIGSTIGKVAQIKDSAISNQQINAVVPSDDFDNEFVFTSFENISSIVKALSAQQAVPIVNKTTFSEVDVFVTQLDEQKKIGDYFRNLDTLITLHQRKLEKLKNIKSACMEKMFV